MSTLGVEAWLPLPTAVVWFGLAVYQVYRDRFRTWTEVFFLATCFFIGAYALSDLFFFNATTEPAARTALLASFSSLTFAAPFFALFGVVFYTRMRNILLVAIAPPLVLLPFLWTSLVVGMRGLFEGEPGPPYRGMYNPTVFATFTVFVLLYSLIGAWAFYRTYREVARQQTQLTRRMRGLMLAFILTVVLGSTTNVITGFFKVTFIPLFSTLLVVPGLVAFEALSPLSKERLSVAVRRWKARGYSIKMGFVIYSDGTLIGAEVQPGEKVIDQDLFSATLDVIQNFMRTSFPTLRGQWLRTITHGDYTLVIERGRTTYLVLVIQGEESDQLRRQMRDAILKFETDNRSILANWRGVPSEAKGTTAMLLSLLED